MLCTMKSNHVYEGLKAEAPRDGATQQEQKPAITPNPFLSRMQGPVQSFLPFLRLVPLAQCPKQQVSKPSCCRGAC